MQWALLLPFQTKTKLRSGKVTLACTRSDHHWVVGCLFPVLFPPHQRRHSTLFHAAPGASLASDYRKHITQTRFPQPSRGHSWTGHPQSRISAPRANQEVIDILYQTKISFLNQTIERYLNPNLYFYEPHKIIQMKAGKIIGIYLEIGLLSREETDFLFS